MTPDQPRPDLSIPGLRQTPSEVYLRRLLAANQPGRAVQASVEHVADELGCPVSWVGLVEGEHLVMGGHVGLVSTEMATAWNLRVGDGIGGRVVAQRRPHMSRDYRHDSRRVPLMKRLIDNEGIQATLTVPILSGDTALGVLYAAHHRPYPWSEHEQHMLEQFAQDLATRLRQLDVDGQVEHDRDAAIRQRDRSLHALRRFGQFAAGLTAQDNPETIVGLLAREVEAGVELARDGDRVLRLEGWAVAHDDSVVARYDLDETDGLTLSLRADHPLDDIDAASSELGAALFRLQWLRLAERERTFERLSETLLDQLVTGRIADSDDVVRRSLLLGLQLTRGRVLVVATRRPDRDQLADFEERLRNEMGRCLVSRRGARLVVVLDMPQGRAEDLTAGLRSLLQAPGASDLVVGIGQLCTHVGDYAISFNQARAGCELGLQDTTTDGIVSTENFGSLALAGLPLLHLHAVAHDVLGAILEVDRERGTSDLLKTLQAYLGNDRHLPTTAAALHVHYNTVRKRVARIEELLGLEFANVEDRFRVETALRMFALTRVLDDSGFQPARSPVTRS